MCIYICTCVYHVGVFLSHNLVPVCPSNNNLWFPPPLLIASGSDTRRLIGRQTASLRRWVLGIAEWALATEASLANLFEAPKYY